MSLESNIKEIIAQFDPISLGQMDRVALMRRTDTKFVLSIDFLPELLSKAVDHYFMVEIKDEREQIYETTYFDTPDYAMYRLHHNGKLNRQKVRLRRYIYSKKEFLEVKRKNNKGETIKKRIEHFDTSPINKDEKSGLFVEKHTPYNSDVLVPTLGNRFIRITLVNKDFKERITLDYDINFIDLKHNLTTKTNGICIAEIKKERDNRSSPFLNYLKEMRINSMGFSKYCIGMAMLNPEVKKNLFKAKIRSIVKL